MKAVLYNYDIFPKVFLGDREQEITLQPLGRHSAFDPDHTYTVRISKVSESRNRVYPERQAPACISMTPDEDGCLRFKAYFAGEGEFHINVYNDPEEKPRLTMSVYSLYEDMAGRIPQRGDLHMHTCCSDGKEGPETVVANYRGHGYDFIVISDHHRYYPSIEARDFFDGVADITVVPGEEVHLPLNDVHYVNFGGTYSINALITPSKNEEKAGDSLEYRSICGKAPDTMTKEEFIEMITKRSASVPREHESERLSFAVMQWVYEHVQAAGGLGLTLKSTNGSIELLSQLKNIDFSGMKNFAFFNNGEEVYEQLLIFQGNIPSFNIGSLNFGFTPSFKENYLLLLVPVLTFVTYFFSMKISKKFMYQPTQNENAPGAGCSTKMMEYSMPLVSTYFAFLVPGAVGIYWIFRSVIMTVKQYIMSKIMPLPQFTEEDYKEAERELGSKKPQRKRKNESEANLDPNRERPRSLHHIDDDDEEYPTFIQK